VTQCGQPESRSLDSRGIRFDSGFSIGETGLIHRSHRPHKTTVTVRQRMSSGGVYTVRVHRTSVRTHDPGPVNMVRVIIHDSRMLVCLEHDVGMDQGEFSSRGCIVPPRRIRKMHRGCRSWTNYRPPITSPFDTCRFPPRRPCRLIRFIRMQGCHLRPGCLKRRDWRTTSRNVGRRRCTAHSTTPCCLWPPTRRLRGQVPAAGPS